MEPLDTETRRPGDTEKDLSSPRHRVTESPRPEYEALKILAACLLLLSFFLPMSSCSYTVPIELGVGEGASDTGNVPSETRTSIMYAREYADLDEIGGWLNILAFFWPFPLLLLQWRFSGRKYSYLLTGSGVFLAAFSAAVVYTWADIGNPLVGAYVGGGAAIALFVLYVNELVQFFRKRGHKESANGESGRNNFA